MDALRHVADGHFSVPVHRSRIGPQKSEQGPHQGGLARPVRTDEGDDLASLYRDVDVVKQPAPATANAEPAGLDERHARRHRFRRRRPANSPGTFP